MLPNRVLGGAAALLISLSAVTAGEADESVSAIVRQFQLRLDQQAADIRSLHQRLDQDDDFFGLRPETADHSCTPGMIEQVPLVAELSVETDCDSTDSQQKFKQLNFYADYERGFVVRPFDKSRFPFEAKLNGWIQFRHHAFSRVTETWTDNAGITRPVLNRNAFDIERARLNLSGYAVHRD